ncbi:MAG TPA: RraA family protein [Thermoanaerobaculia bacterium]|nr:RraA family protein [Thermoanaerobaculia bacterium]
MTTPQPPLPDADLDRLRQLDTCTASNAIERFNVRLRNEGFVDGSVHCRFPRLPPMLGYAVTGRIRSSLPPMTGRLYYDHIEFWQHVAAQPAPRVVVMQDLDRDPGAGAFFGEIHAAIGQALRCVGYVTNGAVRDLAAVEAAGFHLFSGSVAVSHAYAHIVDFGGPIEVGGLGIKPGDLLHGDRNGVHAIPLAVAARLPEAAHALLAEERELIELCASPRFSLHRLETKLHGAR